MTVASSIDPEVIERAKARYAALKAAGQTAETFNDRVAASPHLPSAIDPSRVRFSDTIPGGWYWHGVLAAGEIVRIDNPEATEGVSVLLWNADDPSERLCPPDTIKNQWTARIGRGRVLLSDMGRAIASVVDGPTGSIDCIAGTSTPGSTLAKYGDPTLFNAHDHFIKAASKHGLSKRDVGAAITLFAPLVTDADGRLGWDATQDVAARFDLRAEMRVIVAIANCPHPLAPSPMFDPRPITLTIWRPDAPAVDDLCRTATPEAARAFQNTAANL